jgi:20S proteasome alpha/beta subunit
MTVCIAAICENGSNIVVAADRMFTSPSVSVEFETEEQKIEQIANNCLALSAGNSAYATEILEAVRHHLNANQAPWIEDVSKAVCREYVATRAKKADEFLVVPAFGAELKSYRSNGGFLPAYLEKQPQVFQQITALLSQWSLGVELIVAGIDGHGAHISQVLHPGSIVNLEKLGYATIGSGAIHAVTKLSLTAQTRHRGLMATLHGVYEAKLAAEAAPGVGAATDIAVIDKARGILQCTQPIMGRLQAFHAALAEQPSPNFSELEGTCNAEWPAA